MKFESTVLFKCTVWCAFMPDVMHVHVLSLRCALRSSATMRFMQHLAWGCWFLILWRMVFFVCVCQMSASFHTMNSSEFFFFFLSQPFTDRKVMQAEDHHGYAAGREKSGLWTMSLRSNSTFMYIYMHIYTFSTFPGRLWNWKIFDLLEKND